jgi:HlyD family secretion protein
MTDPRDRQLVVLAGLVQLERRARAAPTPEELGFLMVNETHALVPYRQAAFWRADKAAIQSLSGLAAPDSDAPFTRWLGKRMAVWSSLSTPLDLTVDDMPGEEVELWSAHLPAHGLLLPLVPADGAAPVGLLLLARDVPFTDGERPLLDIACNAYAHAWKALSGPGLKRTSLIKDRRKLALVVTAIALIALFPVRQSVLAQAEIVPHRPIILRASLAGVVEEILVPPNAAVAEGQKLVRMDGRELESRLEVARQALAIADAEQRQAQQQAVFDERAKTSLAVLAARREQAAADVTYAEELLARSQLTAPKAGIAIYDNPDDWAGRPVALGERILMIADPMDVELDILLPAADAIPLDIGGDIRFFLNVDPASPLSATLARIGYRAGPTPDGLMAYRLSGRFTTDSLAQKERLRVGLKGTAKLEGHWTILALQVLRRPLAALRLWLGW